MITNDIDFIKQAEIEILNGETLTIVNQVRSLENDIRHLIKNAKNLNIEWTKFEMAEHIGNLAEFNDFSSVYIHYPIITTPNSDGNPMWVYGVYMKNQRGEEIRLCVYVVSF